MKPNHGITGPDLGPEKAGATQYNKNTGGAVMKLAKVGVFFIPQSLALDSFFVGIYFMPTFLSNHCEIGGRGIAEC